MMLISPDRVFSQVFPFSSRSSGNWIASAFVFFLWSVQARSTDGTKEWNGTGRKVPRLSPSPTWPLSKGLRERYSLESVLL